MAIDYRLYAPGWLAIIRPRILARAGHRCQACGAENRSWVVNSRRLREIRVVLQVAHLDHNPADWSVTDDRLACLCSACHLNHDRVATAGRRVASFRYGRNHRKAQLEIPHTPAGRGKE